MPTTRPAVAAGRPALPPRPRIAIVVPTPDRDRELTRRCLAAVAATTKGHDAVVEVVESSGPDFRFSRSVNRGMAAHPDADAWVLLNDDCVMDAGWLEAMLAAVRARPEVGIVGAVLRYPDGRIQHAGGHFMGRLRSALRLGWDYKAPFWALRELRAAGQDTTLIGFHHMRLARSHRLDFVTAACMLITRACREEVGPWDEEYEFSCEDLDYCLRALEHGFELALATRATGVHLERATGGHLKREYLRSRDAFYRKWPGHRIAAATRKDGRIGIHFG